DNQMMDDIIEDIAEKATAEYKIEISKDSSEVAVMEKRRLSSRNVIRSVKYESIEERDENEEPFVKKSRAESVGSKDKVVSVVVEKRRRSSRMVSVNDFGEESDEEVGLCNRNIPRLLLAIFRTSQDITK
ncbi:hypothetical protein PMAYCL1PPCAC_14229, partial [Pristionchus mayeri]